MQVICVVGVEGMLMRTVCNADLFTPQGAQEVFQGLPVEYIEPEHLPKVAKHGGKVMFVVFKYKASELVYWQAPKIIKPSKKKLS